MRRVYPVVVTTFVLLFADISGLGAQGTSSPSSIVSGLSSDESGTRESEIVACGAPCVPALAELLRTGDVKVRTHAAWVLAQMGPAGAPAVPALVEALKSEEPILRIHAARAMGGGFIVRLPNNWGRDFGVVWTFVAYTTEGIHSNPALSVPALVAALKDADEDVRSQAAQALGACRSATALASSAKVALSEALADPVSIEVRISAAFSLAKFGEARGIQTLVDILKSGTTDPPSTGKEDIEDNRVYAASALGELGASGRTAVAALEAAGSDADAQVAKAAKAALAKIGGAK